MYYFKPLTPDDISARGLVLSLLSSTGTERQSVSSLVNAGALFGIEPATLRVAITRLQKAGLLGSPERGVYIAGPKAKALTRRVQQWRSAPERTQDWDGDWLVALTHQLGRTDRKQVRARERALALSGYRAADMALWVRPANLVGSLADHRADLIDIGADEDIRLLKSTASAPDAKEDWSRLWSIDALEQSYRDAIQRMTGSLSGLDNLDAADAARETLLIGQAVIRTINFDPLLPAELAEARLFEQMVETMKTYDARGQACWAAYFLKLA
ncbi:hypothetical protein [Henriciella litoralis]|uniref:hypothetical protein n=1 Tax=Henriciella litoralis TaxID=568102 RepID=UPI001F2DF1C0|nr:hypothetical protein [Henriciella litoralis]